MPTLVKYNPWSALRDMQDEIGQLFDRNAISLDPSDVATSQWTPRVDIKEEKEKLVIYADLPGVDPKNIEISVTNNVLSIKGERQSERKVEEQEYSRVERFSGTFCRRFTLPDQVDAEQIQARGRHGVLEIVVPKRERHVAKRIEVKEV